MILRREVIGAPPRAHGCSAALIVLAVAAMAALGADRRATDMERRRAAAEAAADAARAELRAAVARLDQLVVPPIPDLPVRAHPDERDLERARRKLALLQLEVRRREAQITCRLPRLHVIAD